MHSPDSRSSEKVDLTHVFTRLSVLNDLSTLLVVTGRVKAMVKPSTNWVCDQSPLSREKSGAYQIPCKQPPDTAQFLTSDSIGLGHLVWL